MAKQSVQTALSTLTFRSTSRPVKAAVKNPREVVLDFLDQQSELAKAESEGRDFSIPKFRYSKNENGEAVKTSVVTTPRRHYWLVDSEWLIEVKYGNILVELSTGFPAVFAGPDLQSVISTLATIRKAVEAGEVDDAIKVASEKARRRKAAA